MPEEAVRDFIKGKAKWGPEPPTEPPTASTTTTPPPSAPLGCVKICRNQAAKHFHLYLNTKNAEEKAAAAAGDSGIWISEWKGG